MTVNSFISLLCPVVPQPAQFPTADTASCKVSDCQLLHPSVSSAQWFHYRLSSQRPTQQAAKSVSTRSSVSCAQWVHYRLSSQRSRHSKLQSQRLSTPSYISLQCPVVPAGSVPNTDTASCKVSVNSFISLLCSVVPAGSVPNTDTATELQSQCLATRSSVSCAQCFHNRLSSQRPTQQAAKSASTRSSVSCAQWVHYYRLSSNAADAASWTESECQLARPLTQPCVVVPLEAISVGNTLPVERSIIVQFVIHLRPLTTGATAYRVCGRLAFFLSPVLELVLVQE